MCLGAIAYGSLRSCEQNNSTKDKDKTNKQTNKIRRNKKDKIER